MTILNLGAGKKLRPDAVNVDITRYPGIDIVTDLAKHPWFWRSETIDGIYASHIMEHFPDQEKFIAECYRILKPGGFLRISAPHASHITSVGCLGHYRTYSYSTFDDYLAKPWYMFRDPMFKTVEQQLRWWYEDPDAEGNLPKWAIPIIKIVDKFVNMLISINPRLWENISLIQCREVIWKGIKL